MSYSGLENIFLQKYSLLALTETLLVNMQAAMLVWYYIPDQIIWILLILLLCTPFYMPNQLSREHALNQFSRYIGKLNIKAETPQSSAITIFGKYLLLLLLCVPIHLSVKFSRANIPIRWPEVRKLIYWRTLVLDSLTPIEFVAGSENRFAEHPDQVFVWHELQAEMFAPVKKLGFIKKILFRCGIFSLRSGVYICVNIFRLLLKIPTFYLLILDVLYRVMIKITTKK